jgi:hypothetical protein
MKWWYGMMVFLLWNMTYFNVEAQKKNKKNKAAIEVGSKAEQPVLKDTTQMIEQPIIQGPQIQFEKETHDFGKIVQGDIVRYQFKFKNTGNKDLVISDVKASCGCTVTQFPKHPIKPQEEATIDVSFNSAAKMGPQNKTLTVFTNAEPSIKVLYIKSEVISPSAPTYLQQKSSNY